jgi:hypothetical protein
VKARSKHINGAELWRRLKQQGFRGCLRVVSEWAARRRRADETDASALTRTPLARTLARLLTVGRDRRSKVETITVAAVENGTPILVEARDVIANLQAMIRTRSPGDLDFWLERACSSLVASFANGVGQDIRAVRAAILFPWSNGQTEGQITKLRGPWPTQGRTVDRAVLSRRFSTWRTGVSSPNPQRASSQLLDLNLLAAYSPAKASASSMASPSAKRRHVSCDVPEGDKAAINSPAQK